MILDFGTGIIVGAVITNVSHYIRMRKIPPFPVLPIHVTLGPAQEQAVLQDQIAPTEPKRAFEGDVHLVTLNRDVGYHGPSEEKAREAQKQLEARNAGPVVYTVNGVPVT